MLLLLTLMALVQAQNMVNNLTPSKFIWLVRNGQIEPDSTKGFSPITLKDYEGSHNMNPDSSKKKLSSYFTPTYGNFSLLFRFNYPKLESTELECEPKDTNLNIIFDPSTTKPNS